LIEGGTRLLLHRASLTRCPIYDRDIEVVAEALRLPDKIQLQQRKGQIDRRLALAILLHWLAFPVRQENDMERFWRRDRRLICRCVVCVRSDVRGNLLPSHLKIISPIRIIDDTVVAIFKKWRHLLWPGDVMRIQANVSRWQAVISRKVRLPPEHHLKVFGFLDGTEREVCKPGGPFINQEALFDGHHHMPALGYLGVTGPDGIMYQFFGPLAGWYNDRTMVDICQLEKMLEGGLFGDGLLYGDKGFKYCGRKILTAFTDDDAGDKAQRFTSLLNSVRIIVEWGFGKILNTFRMHSFTPVQKPHLSRIAIWYLVSVLLMNCQVCLYGSEASSYFECKPPSLKEYLRAEWEEDPAFADAYDTYRPRMYPMRLPGENWTKWNTGRKQWKYLQEQGLEVAIANPDFDEEEE
jgi:hypothetical protein